MMTDDDRWQAVLSRRQEADGQFLYAVKTTGIFCRPTCPSRRPRQKNVEYFPNCAAAEQAGYRPCQRCRPTAASADERQVVAIRKACALLDKTDEPLSLDQLAKAVGMSRSYFHRTFTRLVGVRPKEYADARRLEKLQDELTEGTPVTDAIFEAGYGSSSRVYEKAHQNLGMTPAQYGAGGRDQTIRFATADSDLGPVVVAATDRGICSIELTDASEDGLQRVRSRFPAATLEEDSSQLGSWLQAIVRFIEVPTRGLELPLDIQGTAFQRRVWKALLEIPTGSIATYGEVARSMGEPTAARAVANACGANPVALAVPCHRVVRGDGSPGGYRWGAKRKQLLLEREGETAISSSQTEHPL